MRTHTVKCWPQFFQAVVEGRKTFEARINDRDYKYGDTIVMREWDPATETYTGRRTRHDIGFLIKKGKLAIFPLLPPWPWRRKANRTH